MKKHVETIEEQAKRIMESLLKELKSVEQEKTFGLRRERQMRAPNKQPPNERFRQAFLDNAPKVKDGLVIAEKKQW